MANADVTKLHGRLPIARWKCPHCGEFNVMTPEGKGMLEKYGKYIENCATCNRVHFWKMEDVENEKQPKRSVGLCCDSAYFDNCRAVGTRAGSCADSDT